MSRFSGKVLRWYRDAISSAVLFLIFALFMLSSRRIHVMISSGVTAKFFPMLISGAGMALSAVGFVSGLRRGNAERHKAEGNKAPAAERTAEDRAAAVKSAVSVALIVAYIVLIGTLGFVPASALYLFVQICVLSENWKKRWPLYAVVALVVSVVCYVFFRNVFYLMLPKGIMPF